MRRTSADLILGRKVLRKDSIFRRLLTFLLNSYLRTYFKNDKFHDVDSGFRIFNSRVRTLLLRDDLTFRGFAGCEMVLKVWKAGLIYREVPVSYVGRVGKSRGLPNRTIPFAVLRLLRDLRNFRVS